MTGSILAVPGLSRQSPGFLRELWALSERNGWNPDAIAAILSQESGFNPLAKNPKGSAFGLLQWIKSTQQWMGTSQAELEQMNAEQQLKYVEKFFKMAMGSRIPEDPRSYYLVPYGRAGAVNEPDSFILDRKDGDTAAERRRYSWNTALDGDKDGAITAGDLRRHTGKTMTRAHGKRLTVPGAVDPPDPGNGGEAASPLSLWCKLLRYRGLPSTSSARLHT